MRPRTTPENPTVPDDHHPTRLALLDAGIALAAELPLAKLSVDRIVQRAGVAKGTFYLHFDDRSAFAVALYKRFHELVTQALQQARQGGEPGLDRLRTTITAYLDTSLERQEARALLFDAHADAAVSEEVRQADEQFARWAAADLRAAGVDHPRETARLLAAATVEAARVEVGRGRRQPNLRAALVSLVR
jgi:TetR/AcrR family transcriptional regulator, transcriptional repressor for nem operon